jgi:hypothetical protein
MFEESKTEILITFYKFLLNFIILKLLIIIEKSKTEIIIIFLKFLLNFILLKHLNYP